MSRDIGIGVLMIVPTFVGSGLFWEFLNSWIAVFIWIIIMGVVYGRFLYKKYGS